MLLPSTTLSSRSRSVCHPARSRGALETSKPAGSVWVSVRRQPPSSSRSSQRAIELGSEPKVCSKSRGGSTRRTVSCATNASSPASATIASTSSAGPVVRKWNFPPSTSSRSRAHSIPTSLRFDPDLDEAGFAQHPEVLRHPGLAQRDTLDQLPHRALPHPQQIEDVAPPGLRQHVERGRRHALNIPSWLCACQSIQTLTPEPAMDRRREPREDDGASEPGLEPLDLLLDGAPAVGANVVERLPDDLAAGALGPTADDATVPPHRGPGVAGPVEQGGPVRAEVPP